ncbi:hypothetical protein Y032_0361g3471 [Ancylostoma ceylanicum]|uniref:Uncharacterized protein n=1 Tax=Ancylostoma ceylanicum TaxID=53326 RepID=A0A016RVK5_9BILA|nr:hypothetical protein Y032_0361g3471 [Ancylostoma ceylanicum]
MMEQLTATLEILDRRRFALRRERRIIHMRICRAPFIRSCVAIPVAMCKGAGPGSLLSPRSVSSVAPVPKSF